MPHLHKWGDRSSGPGIEPGKVIGRKKEKWVPPSFAKRTRSPREGSEGEVGVVKRTETPARDLTGVE